MRVEALEDIKWGTYVLTAGDILTVPDEAATEWCAAGWAKDTAGVVPTGERQVLNAKLNIRPVWQGQKSENVEG